MSLEKEKPVKPGMYRHHTSSFCHLNSTQRLVEVTTTVVILVPGLLMVHGASLLIQAPDGNIVMYQNVVSNISMYLAYRDGVVCKYCMYL